MPPENEDAAFDDELFRKVEAGDIPADFQSTYLSGPFVRCVDCETELLESAEVYSVIKSFVVREPVFEMAICARCSQKLGESYSAHSKAAFESALREWRSSPPAGEQQVAGESSAAPYEPGLALGRIGQLEHCAACGRPRSECRRYSIIGTFLGRALVSPAHTPFRLPLLVCDDCNGLVVENISRQTRDSWDRFVEEHFDGPPGVEVDAPRLDPILI